MDHALQSWNIQLRKGAADLAVMSLISRHPKSGAEIFEALLAYPAIGIAEGSIYPLLSRLEREKKIVGAWHASTKGTRNQKIYRLTNTGRTLLTHMRAIWSDFHVQHTAAQQSSE